MDGSATVVPGAAEHRIGVSSLFALCLHCFSLVVTIFRCTLGACGTPHSRENWEWFHRRRMTGRCRWWCRSSHVLQWGWASPPSSWGHGLRRLFMLMLMLTPMVMVTVIMIVMKAGPRMVATASAVSYSTACCLSGII